MENDVAHEGESLAYHLEAVAQTASDVKCFWLHSGTPNVLGPQTLMRTTARYPRHIHSENKLITDPISASTDGFKGKCSNLLVGHVLGFNTHANLHSEGESYDQFSLLLCWQYWNTAILNRYLSRPCEFFSGKGSLRFPQQETADCRHARWIMPSSGYNDYCNLAIGDRISKGKETRIIPKTINPRKAAFSIHYMPPQTQQLYVALCGRRVAPPEGSLLATHHWALLAGPGAEGENERGKRYHVKKRATDEGTFVWFYEGIDIPLKATNMLDIRIAVAKIRDPVRLEAELKLVPVVQADEKWDCITWLKNALVVLDRSGCLGTKCPPWDLVERTAMQYMKSKLAVRRADGRVSNDAKVTTYDLMEEKEINP